ncbi:MAG: hypothetical protein ABIQ95_02945 [Bdellovibrionia bacterium]
MNTKTRFSILMITDDRLSPDKAHQLNLTIYDLKQEFQVEVVRRETSLTDDQILAMISKEEAEKNPYHLVLVPLYRYNDWNRPGGLLEANRVGATLAGYFCESVPLAKIPSSLTQTSRIILDFCNQTSAELIVLIRSLVSDKLRTGIRSLLLPDTSIYFENWYSSQGTGNRFDQVSNLPEIANTKWSERASALQIILSTLWTLVFIGRAGKPGENAPPEDSTSKAYLQIGADSSCLVFRICFTTFLRLTPNHVIQLFSPNPESPTQPGQLLLRYSDFLRVHTLGDTSALEVVVGLLPSASSEKAHNQLHSLWLDPASENLGSEPINQLPTPDTPHLRMLPSISRIAPNLRLIETKQDKNREPDQNDQNISDSSSKIADLREKIKEREEKIKELRQGGIGNTSQIGPPDAEALLEGFRERYFDAKHQIRQFEVEILKLQSGGGSAEEIQTLRLKMDALRNREIAWIKKLMATIRDFKNSKS